MAKIKKRGSSGASKNYITRSQAVRKLQISLPDFRRLCIFKGIYPREPRSKKRVSTSSTPSTTFYYTKDIQYLLHEPLLAKFRDQKALAKKISKALGRNEVGEAERKERNLTPRLRLDHIIKERYPTFVDAVRDLDDALSMLFLFANLPSTAEVPPKIITKCQRLTREFEHYLIRTHSLRKSFLSIKGIYYQATIQGQDVLWLVPYKFVQRTGGDVDFRIMATFVEFYTTLLGFVNFRLYTSIGLVYPPKFDLKAEEQGAGLAAIQPEGQNAEEREEDAMVTGTNEKAQAEADRLLSLPDADGEQQEPAKAAAEQSGADTEEQAPPANTLDTFQSLDAKADALLQPSATADSATAGHLFESFTFFLSRETPRHPLEFILRSFGCKRIGWDMSLGEPGAYCGENDKRITHQIVDRPDLPLPSPPATDGEADEEDGTAVRKGNERVPGRVYVQPQWVWDSINAGQLQRADLYAPGATLPPHLSPWVKARKGEYDPTLSLAEQETAAEIEAAEDGEGSEVDEAEADAALEAASEGEEVAGVRGDSEAAELEEELSEEDGGMDVELAGSDSEVDDAAAAGAQPDDEWGGFSGDEADDTALDAAAKATRDHQAELLAEATGQKLSNTSSAKDQKKAAREASQARRAREEREAREDGERRKMMMPRRKRKMFDKMVYSNARKDEEAEKLRGKRRRIENVGGARAGAGAGGK
ncbi:hypothetical protein B0A50_01553 [Salinomyces thailandicus]|uniref:Pescadillo homolog n=1 Tax=Salinomyces thailandicus TaxID=706561 RepID=A0A4U0UDN3_9PEZI|nr:hypothetical protein B0A50_01553 [Salinomyces thailandica]